MPQLLPLLFPDIRRNGLQKLLQLLLEQLPDLRIGEVLLPPALSRHDLPPQRSVPQNAVGAHGGFHGVVGGEQHTAAAQRVSLLGNEGVFYATAFLTIFFCFAWTHGIMLLTGQHDRRALLKKFCSPTMIGIAIGLVLFFCRIQLPGILQTTFDYVAGLNTPMAMVASGISVAQANLLQAVRTPRVYYVSAVKLLGIPLLLTLLFLPLSFIPMEVRTVVLVLMAAPSAAMCTLQCQKHSMNDVYASGIFAMTTILSMAAMPAVVKLFTTLLELVSA